MLKKKKKNLTATCAHISKPSSPSGSAPMAPSQTTSVPLTHLPKFWPCKSNTHKWRLRTPQLPIHSTRLKPPASHSPNGGSALELTCALTLTMSSSASCQAADFFKKIHFPFFIPALTQGVKKRGSWAQGAAVWGGCCWCKVRPLLLLLSYWFS